MKLNKVLLSEQDIRELIQKYISSIKKTNHVRQERYKSMMYVRLADLGFDRPHITKMINDLSDADTEKDVHSPKHDGNIFKMMNKTKDIYTAIHYEEMEIDQKFLGDLPTWRSFDKFAHSWVTRIAMGTLYVWFYYIYAFTIEIYLEVSIFNKTI